VSQRDLLRLVLANLNRMRARVTLTAFGVIIGTAAVVVLISLGVGLQTSTAAEFSSLGDLTTIQVFQGAPFGFEDPSEPRRGPEVRLDRAALREIGQLPHVVAATPLESIRGQLELRYGRQSAYANTVGLDPTVVDDLGWELASGQPRIGSGQVVLGPGVFESAGPMFVGPGVRVTGPGGRAVETAAAADPGDLQGRTLTAVLTRFDSESGAEVQRRERLRVSGVFEESGGETDYSVYLGLDDVETYNVWFSGERRDPRAGYDQARVKVDDRLNVGDVEDAIEAMGFSTFSSQSILEEVNQVFVIIQGVLGGIGAIALLVAAFGIANTMTMAIYERTKEIGVMKALGATNRDVLRIFLAEAAAIGVLGGVLGVVVGWALGQGIDLFLRAQTQGPMPDPSNPPQPVVVTPVWLVVFAVVFATVIGLASGIYPALRAASMKPLQALRTE
jgi:putative ABC transport system permease protein